MRTTEDWPLGNRLLALLPRTEYKRLSLHLVPVFLELKQKLFEPNKPIEFVYFPVSGVVSLLSVLKDGTRAEVATVGNEGMVGLPVFLGATSVPIESFSQIAGDAMQLDVASFREEIRRGGELPNLLRLYTQALLDQMAQTVSCNRNHNLEERCCRWLLMCCDRVGGNGLSLRPEFLAQMLGIKGSQLKNFIARLQRKGLVKVRRGLLDVPDCKELEKRSCECYRVIRDEYERLFSKVGPQPDIT